MDGSFGFATSSNRAKKDDGCNLDLRTGTSNSSIHLYIPLLFLFLTIEHLTTRSLGGPSDLWEGLWEWSVAAITVPLYVEDGQMVIPFSLNFIVSPFLG